MNKIIPLACVTNTSLKFIIGLVMGEAITKAGKWYDKDGQDYNTIPDPDFFESSVTPERAARFNKDHNT